MKEDSTNRTFASCWQRRLIITSQRRKVKSGMQLKPGTGKFKDASILYTSVDQINTSDLQKWLKKSRDIQWDYKNIRKKGVLERLK